MPGAHRFKNVALEEKTAALQAEFNELLAAQSLKRSVAESFIDKDESFYSTMSEFYSGHRKHDSPTRRLMEQMDSACENKSVINRKLRTNDRYTLTYCTSPDKSYVVEPSKGEIDYDNANKNLEKFYLKVMNQDITKHTLKRAANVGGESQAELKAGRFLVDGKAGAN